MKIKKLTMALVAAGALCTTGAIASNHTDTYEEGPAPNLTVEQELMVVLYEAMLSAAAAMVVATDCTTMEQKGPYPFAAQVFSASDTGRLRVGKDSDEYIWFTAIHQGPPAEEWEERGEKYYLRQGIWNEDRTLWEPGTTDGQFYQDAPFWLADFNNVTGVDYPEFEPAFSRNSAIFLNNAYMRITPNPQLIGSIYDEHVIKDFYKLTSTADLEGKCEGVPDDHPHCNTEDAFFDWGLEVITKWDYPHFKFRQDSEHVPWDGSNGWWYIQKRLIADGSYFEFEPTPDCHITAQGLYDGTVTGQGDASFSGNLTFEQQD